MLMVRRVPTWRIPLDELAYLALRTRSIVRRRERSRHAPAAWRAFIGGLHAAGTPRADAVVVEPRVDDRRGRGGDPRGTCRRVDRVDRLRAGLHDRRVRERRDR